MFNFLAAERYLKDINYTTGLFTTTGGKVTKAFAELLRELWSGLHSSYSPTHFKSVFGEKLRMFSGYDQHDAQEFLSFLIDALQEELNRCKLKNNSSNTCENVYDFDFSNQSVAEQNFQINQFFVEKGEEKWKEFLIGNDSIITHLFFGQYLSYFACPVCPKVCDKIEIY